MRLVRDLSRWLRRSSAASDQGVGNLYRLPWVESVQPVEIVSDATALIAPYQRRLYWDRVTRSASGTPGEFSVVGIAPTKYPTRIHYWQVEAIGSGNSFLGLLNTNLFAVTGNVAILEPIEGPRDFTTTVPFSLLTSSTIGSDGQVVGARECPWIQACKPVVWPGQVFGSVCITDQVLLTVVMCFEEIPLTDPAAQMQLGET